MDAPGSIDHHALAISVMFGGSLAAEASGQYTFGSQTLAKPETTTHRHPQAHIWVSSRNESPSPRRDGQASAEELLTSALFPCFYARAGDIETRVP